MLKSLADENNPQTEDNDEEAISKRNYTYWTAQQKWKLHLPH